MRDRRVNLCALVSWLLLAAPTPGQTLDLGGGPSAPPPGSGAATRAMAEDLVRQAAATNSAGDAAASARAAARVLAARLISTGEAMGQTGSARIVLGRTLARGMEDLDRAIGSITGPTAEADLSLLARDFAAAAAALAPPEADACRITRDALAGVLGRGGEAAGWIDEPALAAPMVAPLGPELAAWSAAPGVAPEAIEALRGLDAVFEAAETWGAYRPAAARLRAAVRAAAAAPLGTQQWVPAATRERLGADFSAAARELASDNIAGAPAALARLGRLARLISRVDELDDSAPGRRVRAAVADAAAGLGGGGLDAMERTLDLALFKPADDRSLVRHVRPAWRIIAPTLRQTEQKLLGAMPEILARPEAMTDPAVLSAIAAHRRVVQDLQMLAGLSATLGERGIDLAVKPGEQGPQPRWVRISDRVLRLGQDMAKPEGRDEALASLRELAGQLERFLELPGEASLRRGGPAWEVLAGGKQSALLSEISDRRGGWLDGWDRQGYAGAAGDIQRLDSLRAIMETMHDLVPVVEATDARAATGGSAYTALLAWPGWELSPESLGELCRGMSDRTAEAVALITSGDAAKAQETVAQVRRDFAVAILAGRLARELEGRGQSPERTALSEAAAGGPAPGQSWMAERAAALADICRYGEEAAAAWKAKESQDRAESLTRFVNRLAAEILEKDL